MRHRLSLAVAISCLSLTFLVSAHAEKVSAASQFPLKGYLGDAARRTADFIDTATGGKIKIVLHEPEDLVPSKEVFDAVSSGAIGAAWVGIVSAAGGKIPVSRYFGGAPFGPSPDVLVSWTWEGGGYEILRPEFEKLGVVPLLCDVGPAESGGWFNKEINSPDDLRGLKMRIVGLGSDVLTGLGASTQSIPGSELYLALERGRVDAAEYSSPATDLPLGFPKVAKYYYEPGWHQQAGMNGMLINKVLWDKWPETVHKQIMIACRAALQQSLARSAAPQVQALRELEKQGAIVKRLPDSVLSALKNQWNVVLKNELKDPVFKKAHEQRLEWEGMVNYWSDLQDLSKIK